MSQMTDYLEGELLKHLFRTGSMTKPSTIYIGLYTATPSDTGGGTEVSGGSYARVQVGPSDATWAAVGAGGLTDNVSAITFPTATGSWGTVTHVGIFDASSGGNLLLYGALSASKVVGSGDTFKFNAGDLDVTFA